MTSNEPIDFRRILTYPLKVRKSKVSISQSAKVWQIGGSFSSFLKTLPDILAGSDLKKVIKHIIIAREKGKPVIVALGAHVIKCGLSLIIIDLMKRGIISAVALNGAGIIHDFELAYVGHTSEDVDEQLPEGQFGLAQETGTILNETITQGIFNQQGIGESIGKKIISLKVPHLSHSILAAGVKLGIPVTVHVGIGTDIIHIHPQASGAAIGEASYLDFRIFVKQISKLDSGGVYINIGSAVILPEVFLKAVSAVRGLDLPLANFTTVNMDFIQHYRPRENVLRRPIINGGESYALTGHHEILIPLLAAGVLEELEDSKQNSKK